MTGSLTFIVPGEPMSKARPRFRPGGAYTPAQTVAAEVRVLICYLETARTLKAAEGPLSVSIRFDAATRVRRDIDNLAKLVLDGLNGYAWVDDSQIHRLVLDRSFVAKGAARTVVTICPFPEGTAA